MTTTTSKGLRYPESSDKVIEGNEAIQALAEDVDAALDGYTPKNFGHAVGRMTSGTADIGTVETAILTTSEFTLTDTTVVQISFSWRALSSTTDPDVTIALKLNSVAGTQVASSRQRDVTGASNGGTILVAPELPAGTYTVIATMRTGTSPQVVSMLALPSSPATLLAVPLA